MTEAAVIVLISILIAIVSDHFLETKSGGKR